MMILLKTIKSAVPKEIGIRIIFPFKDKTSPPHTKLTESDIFDAVKMKTKEHDKYSFSLFKNKK